MALKIGRNARQNLKGPGWHLDKDENGDVAFLEDAAGVPKGAYYDPKTGQQFIGLPTDPWSSEHYRRVRKLRFGHAPVELAKKWELAQKRLRAKVGVLNKPMPHDVPLTAGAAEIKSLSDQVTSLTKLVETLLKKQDTLVPDPIGDPVV